MDISVNVVGQKMHVATNLKNLVAGTQEFVRFVFYLSDDWANLTTFAQFRQDSQAYNAYLDSENSVYLPPEIQVGTCTMVLYGTGGNTIGTTNYLTLVINDNMIVSDAQSTNISTSLYTQLVNAVGELSDKVTEIEENGASSEIIRKTVQEELDTYLNSGALANMTIADGSISRSKVDSSFEATLAKADSAMQPSIYDPQGIKTDIFAYTQARVGAVQTSVDTLQSRLNTIQNTVDTSSMKVDDMYDTYLEMRTSISTLQTSVNNISNDVLSVTNRIGNLENTVNTVENSIYTINKTIDIIESDIDAIEAKITELENSIVTTNNRVDTINSEISDARKVGTTTYSSLGNAIRGVLDVTKDYAKNYTDSSFASYVPFTIQVVNELPTVGEPLTYYLIANDSGTKYDKYWWITDENGVQKWDVFGGSSTLVVSELPESGEEDVDYILNTADSCLYYKWIDGKWCMVAGSMAVVLDELPESGNGFTDYYVLNENNSYVHYRFIDGEFVQVGSDSYTRDEVDTKIAEVNNNVSGMDGRIESVESSLDSLNKTVTNLQQTLNNLDTEGYTYYATYGTAILANGEETDNVYTLYQVKGDEETVVSQFVITGGGGGGSAATTNLVVEKVTQSPVTATVTDKVEIQINYSSTDADGEQIDGTYTWKLGNSIIVSGELVQGLNTFDMTEYVSIGSQKLTLTVVDAGGSTVVKTWTVNVVDIRLESSFNDKITYPANKNISFTYIPYGSLSKTVHFIMDGVELDSVTTSASGISQSYALDTSKVDLSHGAHLLECYMTAVVNNVTIETTHVYKSIMCYDSTYKIPVIGCIYQHDYYGKVTARQYDSTTITYYVYDPNTSVPAVTHTHNGVIVATENLTSTSNTWTFKTDEIGEHTLVISCGVTSVTIVVDVRELGIDVSPVTSGLAFDFNPVGYSNSSENRMWSDSGVTMSVSDNFDWTNGGYQLDNDGNQYFCVKAGTSAVINYNLFERDASLYGSEFKVIFKVTNVRNIEATFLSCQSDATMVGLQMDAHAAYLKTSATGDSPLYMPYSEEDIIEFEFNINTLDAESGLTTAVIMSYEDGVGYRPLLYDAAHRLYQNDPVPITIGSPDCDVHIYRMKAYENALTDADILSNFIADARDSEEMLDRYYRNQIYDENNALTPESVATARPDLKVIKIDCPYFTQDKKEMIKNTTIECIHKGGDVVLDNWKAINCAHSGQGTTSNEYGYAGRNLNLYMCFDGEYKNKNITYDPDYITELTMGDGTKYTDGTGKVTLTRTSVPNNLYNVKVNIASSENANNAILAKRYNEYLPYTPVSKRRDSNAKITMEFVNCVVFVRENDPDLSTHREFQDNEWHFYALGNIGDSKDTDQTRANDPDDHNEFVVEISDNTKPNSIFPSGVENEDGKQVYPIDESQWVPGNTAYDSLHDSWDSTYEFRYEHPDVTDEEETANIQIWNDFYKWVITATDDQFVNELNDWFVEGAAEYFYLFTERYTMLDNRAKNTFWHWGKVYISDAEATAMGEEKASWFILDNEKATIHNGYRFDFWGYDKDTSLGINNSGEMKQPYGKEDYDYNIDGDPNSGYVYNGAESTFFCRIRDLMYSRLQTMYLNCETSGVFSSTSLITEIDNWQAQFPEELWRLDIERKYYRTYQGGTERFLKSMMNGRKKYHRRQWERDQDPYMGTKYVSASVKADQIMFRCNTPQSAVVAPNYDLKITPYSDMYINVLYGNSGTPERIRAKAGVEYEIKNPLSGAMDDTAVLIYNCSRVQELNDLSGCYIHDNDFSKASKLQKLIIGNSTDGYSNSFLTALNIGNNALLQLLDVRNCPNLTGSVNLTNCGNLEVFYANGTSVTGVLFAPNGKIATAYLPDTVNTLSIRNLIYLNDLWMSYDNLESLTVEDSEVLSNGTDNVLAIVKDSVDTLQTLKLTEIDWELPDTTLLNQILAMRNSTLTGKVYISGAVRYQELYSYESAWSDLEVTYDPENIVTQYVATYVNADGMELYSTYVDRGAVPPDPVAVGLIVTPTLASTAQYDYTYSGWDDVTSVMLSNRTITAVYDSAVRSYTVTWYSRSGLSLGSVTAEYGSEVVYPGELPTRTDEEETYVYNVFTGWDKSTGYITGNTNVYAVWDRSELPGLTTDFKDMSVAQIYGVATARRASDYLEEKDYHDITMGHDFNFSNVESEVLAEDLTLDGATTVNTGIKLFGENEESFTLAIDFQFTSDKSNNTLLACYEENGSEGFRLRYNNYPNIQWGNATVDVGYGRYREMVVLRHIKGENTLYVYSSNGMSTCFTDDIVVTELVRNRTTTTEATIVLGAIQFLGDGGYDEYGNGVIYWCKLWHGDLGDTNARQLASWTHETLRMEFDGVDRYRLAGNTSQRANISMIANNLPSDRGYQMNSSNTNVGGWNASAARKFYNGRLFNAMPVEWQSIIKTVKISASAGNKSSEIIISEDKLYSPAYAEIQSTSESPYADEGECINWMTSDLNRVKFKGHIIPDDAVYFTATSDPSAVTSNKVKTGDIWYNSSTAYTCMFISTDELNKYGITPSTTGTGGGWIRGDTWWTRSANPNYSTYFDLVSANGNTQLNSATAYAGACIRFSV